MLDLPEDQAQAFWFEFEGLRDSLGLEGAWLRAFEHACVGTSAFNEALGGTLGPTLGSLGLTAAHSSPQAVPADVAEKGEGPDDEQVLYQPPLDASGRATETPAKAVEERDQLESTETSNVQVVQEAWHSEMDNQLEVNPGDLIRVEWKQPRAEGAYWAYGRLLVDGVAATASRVGYIPLRCLVPPALPPSLREGVPGAGDGCREALPTTQRGGAQPAHAAASAERAGPRLWRRAAGRRGAAGQSVAGDPGGGDALNGAVAAEASEYLPHKAPARAPQACQVAPSPNPLTTCPLCDKDLPSDVIEAHAETCTGPEPPPPRTSAVQRRAAAPCSGEAPTDCELPAELRHWAEVQVAKIIRRFCATQVDASVVISALASCHDPDSVRGEAIHMFGDNAPVKNFAAEFWSRRAGPGQRRPARIC